MKLFSLQSENRRDTQLGRLGSLHTGQPTDESTDSLILQGQGEYRKALNWGSGDPNTSFNRRLALTNPRWKRAHRCRLSKITYPIYFTG